MPTVSLDPLPLGERVPQTVHCVSVSVPSWVDSVKYMEKSPEVWDHLQAGYPRFYIHEYTAWLSEIIEIAYGRVGEKSFTFRSKDSALRTSHYIKKYAPFTDITPVTDPQTRIVNIPVGDELDTTIWVIFFPEDAYAVAKEFWSWSGEITSSRFSEYCLYHMQNRLLEGRNVPAKYDSNTFDVSYSEVLASEAVDVIRRRIASYYHDGKFTTADDVYLYPSGMGAIFNAYRACMSAVSSSDDCQLRSVCFGFPFAHTIRIMKKYGPGVEFLGLGDDASLDQLERMLKIDGERFSCLICEFPSNPLMKSPDIQRIKKLSNDYGFLVIVDDTVGNPFNIDIIEHCDIVVTSLTKLFAGEGDVMAGSLVLNKNSGKYEQLKHFMNTQFEELLWGSDALVLAHHSRDFKERSDKINKNAEKAVKLFLDSPLIANVFYPSITSVESRSHYDAVKTKDGGYGGLISIVFKDKSKAIKFYDTVQFSKGPSLGTNFTLMCPFVLFAHFNELEEVWNKWGVHPDIIRISIGMEEPEYLVNEFARALSVASV